MVEIDFGCAVNLEHIFECGQCFRWNRLDDGSYVGVANGERVRVKHKTPVTQKARATLFTKEGQNPCGSKIIIEGTNDIEFWENYFDLGFDYEGVKAGFCGDDEVLARCAEYGYGIRILRQDLFEVIISFIISANNNIPRIKKIVESLCELCGDGVAFPTAEMIVEAGLEKLGTIGAGYRARYIYGAAKMWLNWSANPVGAATCRPLSGDIACGRQVAAPTSEIRKELLQIPGVGPKVADCVLLFGLRRFDVFPADVWIQRILDECYGVPSGEIAAFAESRFGEFRGLAQQYLFYYFRETGKKSD